MTRSIIMDPKDQEVIRKMYVRLDKNLEATPLLSYLYQENVLSDEDMEKIDGKTTRKKKAEKLIKILKRRKNGLKMLIKALLLTKVQAFLAHELLEHVTWGETVIENLKLEIEDQINLSEKLELDIAILQNKYNQLEITHNEKVRELEATVAELNQAIKTMKQELEQKTDPSHQSHHGSHQSNGVFTWFRNSFYRNSHDRRNHGSELTDV